MHERHGSLLARDQHHLGGISPERPFSEAIVRLLDHQPVCGKELRQVRGGVKSNGMFSCAPSIAACPRRSNSQQAGKRIELAFLGEQGFLRCPPVARQKASHDSVATTAVPDEQSTPLEYPGEFLHDASVVSRMGEEAKRSEQVEDSVELIGPLARQHAHVALGVAKIGTGSTLPCDAEQFA